MEHRHRRSRQHLRSQRQQSLCFPASHRNAYSHSYSIANTYSNSYTHRDCYFDCNSDCDLDPNIYTNSHSGWLANINSKRNCHF